MDSREFRAHAHELVDWIADYLENIESYPVMSRVRPGEIRQALPAEPPRQGEPFSALMADFERLIIPGITHWQHPSFFAYFPANSSPSSLLAEMLTAALGVQAMVWQTSPAATELEEVVTKWLVQMLGLPDSFCGVIQDTASTATLCSLLTARERASDFSVNENGFSDAEHFTCYCSTETHSSIEKAVKIAGIGRANLRKVAVDERMALRPDELERVIAADLAAGFRPLWLTATLGTTGSTAFDPLPEISEICGRYGIWLHVDAALAGTALLLPEMRGLAAGLDKADSFVFNPHKWMFTNFDCSVYLLRDPAALVRTFEIMPEYLKTSVDKRVNNYRDWGVQLGRRFRALKLWFVIRHYGVTGLQETIRRHIAMAGRLAVLIEAAHDFELLAPVPLNTVCFRYRPAGCLDEEKLDRLNQDLMNAVNADGRIYLTHTRLAGKFSLRLVIGQTNVQWQQVAAAWELLQQNAGQLGGESD